MIPRRASDDIYPALLVCALTVGLRRFQIHHPLCGSLLMMKPCLGTGGMAGADEVCPQTSGKVSCSQDEALSPVVFAAVPASWLLCLVPYQRAFLMLMSVFAQEQVVEVQASETILYPKPESANLFYPEPVHQLNL